MKKSNSEKSIRVETAEELGRALGLSRAETGEMEFRSDLTCALAKIIRNGKMTHAEIAKKAGTSRTRVTAIAAVVPVSPDGPPRPPSATDVTSTRASATGSSAVGTSTANWSGHA